jgi:hypothetical protein
MASGACFTQGRAGELNPRVGAPFVLRTEGTGNTRLALAFQVQEGTVFRKADLSCTALLVFAPPQCKRSAATSC